WQPAAVTAPRACGRRPRGANCSLFKLTPLGSTHSLFHPMVVGWQPDTVALLYSSCGKLRRGAKSARLVALSARFGHSPFRLMAGHGGRAIRMVSCTDGKSAVAKNRPLSKDIGMRSRQLPLHRMEN